jgi:surface polysaccharide O-acyltransferase-like enzyme
MPFPGAVGIFFISAARYAVPFFFMISGYTLFRYIELPSYTAKVCSRVKRNLFMALTGLVVYYAIDVLKCLMKGEGILAFTARYFEPKNLLLFLFANVVPPGSGSIVWFLFALIYAYLIKLLIQPKRKNVYTVAGWSLLAMLVANVAKVYFTAFPTELFGVDLSSYWLYGNWLFVGLPCVNIGLALAKLFEEYSESLQKRRKHCWLAMAVCLLLNFAFCLYLDRKYGMYLSYTPFTLLIDAIIFLLSTKDFVSERNALSWIGKNLAGDIYLWHHTQIFISNFVITMLGIGGSAVAEWGQPVLVICMTLVLCTGLYFLKCRIESKVSTHAQ